MRTNTGGGGHAAAILVRGQLAASAERRAGIRQTEYIKENVSMHDETPSDSGVIYSLNWIPPIVYNHNHRTHVY